MKVALIAMSGIRCYNRELMRLGMTLPGFVERSRVIASLPSLSLLTLAGMTPDRFEVDYYEVDDLNELTELPQCDLAAISMFSPRAHDAYALSRRYREAGVRTVIGGLHATVLPQESAQNCDAVVVGEGELSWPAVLADAEAGRLQPLYSPAGREFDFAEAPLPRFELLQPERYNRLTVQTQRGCPWHCEFCASSIVLTPRYKVKPVAKVIDEIRAIKRIWRHPFVEFADDNTFVNKRHSKELMRALAGEHVRWFTETDISVADDPELLQLMRQAGCAEILIGLESPTAAALDGVELKQNWKHRQVDRYRDAIARIQSHGIAVNGCFVLGLDGDTDQVFDAIWRFVEESGLYDVQITVMTAFPGTPMYARLQAEDRLLDPLNWQMCTLFDINVRPKQMSVDELQRGLVDLGQRLYSEDAKQARIERFRGQFRRSFRTARKEVLTHG